MAKTGSWVWDRERQQLVPKAEYYSRKEPPARSTAVPLPRIGRTTLDDVWNPVNGQRYTCMRAYERAVKDAGCEIVGNDAEKMTSKPFEPPPAHEDVKRAWDELTS